MCEPMQMSIKGKGLAPQHLNSRPVSLMISFSEVFEKVMYNGLLRYLNNDNILVEEHSGFRKNLTTEKATYELMKL